ncbi:YegP family protein [Maribacter sp. X9]|uniref:YegP family protein n=1 Tax=Maribacter sp. X9 TaxID=3402159 RepID=UPI003AF3ACB0
MIEFKKNEDNTYHFCVKSNTGKTLLKSVPFPSEDSMKSSLKALKQNEGINSKLFERKTNTEGKFLVALKNTSGEIIGSSGLYSSEAGMENGILNISNSLFSDLQSD